MKIIVSLLLFPAIVAGVIAACAWRGLVTGWNLTQAWIDTW